jgi:hypothetical protein
MASSSSSFWGPSAWHFLHTMTFNYPERPTIEEQNSAEQFFLNLSKLLPCAACREHYEKEITKSPPLTSSKVLLSSWLVDIHNRINKRLKKPIFSYKDAKLKYLDGNSQCKENCNSNNKKIKRGVEDNQELSFKSGFLFFLVTTCIAIGGFYYIKYKKEKLKI